MIQGPPEKFAVFILTHGRPGKVSTYQTLRFRGYTGPIYLIVDNLDPTIPEYREKYGDQVIVFDKAEASRITDCGINDGLLRGVLYARNISFKLASDLGLKYFLALDDDYSHFAYRFDETLRYKPTLLRNFDRICHAMIRFLESAKLASIAFAQGGDFIGGEQSPFAQHIQSKRKCMNSFFCAVDRPFRFSGRTNEDVTAYVQLGSVGLLFLTINQISLDQGMTQQNAGGLTEIYLDEGTYIKSFYTVMYHPSSVTVRLLRDRNAPRLHHQVRWRNTVPMIVREEYRKPYAEKTPPCM